MGTERAPSLYVIYHRTSSWAAVVLVGMLTSGCSRKEPQPRTESAAGSTADTTAQDADTERVAADAAPTQTVLRQLADRDEALLEMARMAVTRKEQLKVSDDARRILSEARKESNGLLAMLKGDYRLTYTPHVTDQDQSAIDSLNGVGTGEFDRAFLQTVAAHHEADAQLIERALPSVSPRARETLSGIRTRRMAEAAAFKKQIEDGPASRR